MLHQKLLPFGLQKALHWPSNDISFYDLEHAIWETHWKMHVLCRKDPDPRISDEYLIDNQQSPPRIAESYRFGLLESEIQDYRHLADLHHGLVLLRYGSSRLYPYLMTRVDIVPSLLAELPFHSIFRGSTEGGEHCHYLHQCQYYAHSSRGGGWNKEDPILSIFKWTYRRLRERIEEGSKNVKEQYEKFVQKCIDDQNKVSAQKDNMQEEEPTLTPVQPDSDKDTVFEGNNMYSII